MNKPINIDADCKFLKDLEDTSANVNLGMYNLICSKRDLKLYLKVLILILIKWYWIVLKVWIIGVLENV